MDFYLGWIEYKNGFGNLTGEFWLGLDNIYRLTTSGSYKLRVDLELVNGEIVFAEYDLFRVESEEYQYMVNVESFSGLISLRSLINFIPSNRTSKENTLGSSIFYFSLINESLNLISELLETASQDGRGFYDVKKLARDKHPFSLRYRPLKAFSSPESCVNVARRSFGMRER